MSLDMSDVVCDLDLQANYALNCTRQARTVDTNGLTVITPTAFTIYATVVPANGRQLQRLAEMDRVGAGIAVYTTTELIDGAAGFAPDIITWKGQPYLVAFIDDFSTNGFYGAVATLTAVQGPAPGTSQG